MKIGFPNKKKSRVQRNKKAFKLIIINKTKELVFK